MIQDKETDGPDREWPFSGALFSESLYDDGNSFWFTGSCYNSLFRMDKEDHRARSVGMFPDEDLIQWRPYSSTSCCNGKLYFAPFSAKEIAEYDPKEERFRKIPVESPDIPRREGHRIWKDEKFFKIAVIEERVYFIPYHYPGILCYDTRIGTLTCFDDWIDRIEEIRAGEWGYFVAYEVSGSRLILPCACADAVVILDMISGTSQIIPTSGTGYTCKFCGISRVEDLFYLVSADGTVRKRRLEAAEEEERIIRLPTTAPKEIEFYPMQYAAGSIYLFPFRRNKGIRIDTRTDLVEPEPLFDDETGSEGDNFCFLTSIYDGKKLYTSTGNSHRFLEYDLVRGEKKERKLFLSKEDRDFFREEKKKGFVREARKSYVTEDAIYPLGFMLDVVQTDGIRADRYDGHGRLSFGKKIYEALRSG